MTRTKKIADFKQFATEKGLRVAVTTEGAQEPLLAAHASIAGPLGYLLRAPHAL